MNLQSLTAIANFFSKRSGEIDKFKGDITDLSNDPEGKAQQLITKLGQKSSGENSAFTSALPSVARAAKANIMYFPVLISETLGVDTANILAKAVQVRSAEYLKIMIQNLDAINSADIGKAGLLQALRGETFSEDVNNYLTKNLDKLIEHTFIEDEINKPLILIEAKKPQPSRPSSSTATPIGKALKDKLQGYDDDGDTWGEPEASWEEIIRNLKAGGEKNKNAAIAAIRDAIQNKDDFTLRKLRSNDPIAKNYVEMLNKYPTGTLDSAGYFNKSKLSASGVANVEFDKLNAFQPIILSLSIRYANKVGDPLPITDTVTVGIKSVLHPLPSIDLVTGLGSCLQENNFFLQFLKLTTGEISFVGDFLLNLNKAKARASSDTTKGIKALETLRRQAEWNSARQSKVVGAVSNKNFVPPTSTLIVTADEIDKIKSSFGVDFNKPASVKKLLQIHNLMGFMIIDEAIGLVRVYEDGDNDFDRVTLASLKERGKDTSMKDIVALLARN